MGVVVAARHLELGELFAIKLLLPQAAEHPQAVERFLREARAAARLKGEHIAKVTDVGRLENGLPYIVMEYLSGTDLKKHLRANGPLSVSEAVTHILQACEAIAEAHALGIVHRDLKPANLFLTRRANGTSCIKVLDFGISKQLAAEAVDITKTGEALGTPLYMAPEQMARMKSADARCDVWSMGVVLYELLTGTTPFHGSAITEIVARVLQEEALPPSQLRPDLPRDLDGVVIRCLQKRPEMRYPTIGDLAAALRALTGVASEGRASLPGAPALDLAGTGQSHSMHSLGAIGPAVAPTLDTATHRMASGSLAPVPAANTGAAWGATGQLRPTRRSGGVWVIGAVSGVVAVGLSFGIWRAVQTSSEVAPGAALGGEVSGSTAITAGSTAPVVPGVTATASATGTGEVTPSGTGAKGQASAAPSGTASATASSTGKAVGKKPSPGAAAPTPTPTSSRFGGIR